MITGINRYSAASVGRALPAPRVATPRVESSPINAPNSASTKVTFGSQTGQISAVYSMSPEKMNAGSGASAISNAMIQGLMKSANTGAGVSVSGLSALGGALLSGIEDNRADISQALSNAEMGTDRLIASTESAVTLDITTKSGSVLHLVMTRQEEGMLVEVNTEGKALTDEEASAVAKLGDAFQKVLNGLGKQPPSLDVDGLLQYDSNVLSAIDLKTDVRNGDHAMQSLNFHVDSAERWVAYEDPDYSLKMTSDTSRPELLGNQAEQQKALNAWEQKFDKARSDGKGDRAQMDMLKDVFRTLNKSQGDDSPAAVLNTQIRLGSEGQTEFKGLNDFSLSLKQTEKSINPARMDEKERFSWEASQTTEDVAGSDGARSSVQTAYTHLKASWHETLDPSIPLSLNMFKSSQNYYYTAVDNEEKNSTSLNYNAKGEVESIGTQSQVDNNKSVSKYVMGKLVDQINTPEEYKRENVLNLLRTL